MFNVKVFEDILHNEIDANVLSKDTAKYYISSLKMLNSVLDGKKASSAEIAKAIETICLDNTQGLKYIAAVKKYEKCILGSPKILLFGEPLSKISTKYKLSGKGKPLSLAEDTYLRKINALRNKRLQLAYRLQHASGLRISEIAALDKDRDIIFDKDEKIILNVRKGKGNKQRIVDCLKDPYLFAELKKHLASLNEDEQPFYAKSYMKKKADEYGFETHDLRRLNARKRYRKYLEQGKGKRVARRAVSRQLGHEDVKTTSIYVGDEW